MKEKFIPPLDDIAAKIAGIGVLALILVMAIGATGYVGVAAVTTALAALGPGGMVGGVITLLASGTIGLGIMSLIELLTSFVAIFKISKFNYI